MMASQHSELSEDRWSKFTLDQQILMIGNEMNRARKEIRSSGWPSLRNCYERILRLTDLTIGAHQARGLRRELLRWRDLIAQLYITERPDLKEHDDAFRCLLRFTPLASQQIPLLFRAAQSRARPSEDGCARPARHPSTGSAR